MFIFIKNEGNISKNGNKVPQRSLSGRVRGRVRDSFIVLINMIIYTQYVITAYCFIMYYNTEVQISATICTKYKYLISTLQIKYTAIFNIV